MSDLAFTFDWQAEHARGGIRGDNFYTWMIPTLITKLRLDAKDVIDHLGELTDNFASVEMTIHINGVEVNAKELIDRLEANYEHAVGCPL